MKEDFVLFLFEKTIRCYNQIANYVYTQSEINIKIKDDAPCDYMSQMKKQVAGEGSFYGGITDIDDLRLNLAENCVPEEFMEMDIFNYQVFLDMRRRMMAQYIREYYESLVYGCKQRGYTSCSV